MTTNDGMEEWKNGRTDVHPFVHSSTPPLLPIRRFAGIFFYSIVLIALVLLTRTLYDAASDRWRGVVRGVPAQTRQVETAPWGTTVALEQYNEVELDRALDRLEAMGVVWLRQELPWSEMEPARGNFDWSRWDQALRAAHERGFQLILVLNTSPEWARPLNSGTELAPPVRIEDFANFADAVSRRYANAADAYQIWDEPNLRPHWGVDALVDPVGYANMLRTAAAPIRRNDSDALILTAGLAPNGEAGGFNMSEQRFLRGLYEAGAADDFDVVGYKAFGFWTGPDDRRYDETILNWSRAALLREVMVEAGDTETSIWFTEGGWASLPAVWQGQPAPWGSDRPDIQTERLRDAVARTRLEWPWVGVMALQAYQPNVPADDPRWGLALVDQQDDMTPIGETWQQIIADSDVLTPGWWPADAWPRSANDDSQQVRVRGSKVVVGATHASPLPTLADDLDPSEVTAVTLPNEVPAQVIVTYEPSMWWNWWIAVALPAVLAAGAAARLSWLTWHLPWAGWRERYRALPEPAQIGIFALYLILFFVAPGHPVLSALLYLGLGVLVWARLDLGLAAILATLPFFLWGKSFGPLRFSLPELLTVLCAVRWGVAHITQYAIRNTRPLRDYVLRLAYSVIDALRPRDLLDWSVVAFVALSAASVFWAQLFGVAAREFRVVVLEPAIFYWLIRRAGLDRTQMRRLIDALLLGGVLVSLHALWQIVGGGAIAAEGVLRVKGPYGSPNNLSLYLGRLVPLALTFWVYDFPEGTPTARFTTGDSGLEGRGWGNDETKVETQNSQNARRKTQDAPRNTQYSEAAQTYAIRNIAYLAALVPIALALFLTFSRGALLLGLPAALLYLALISGRRRVRIATVSMIVLAIFALIPFAATERIQSLFNPNTGTWHLRLLLWRAGVDMVREFPILGVGLDNFLYIYPEFRYEAAWREPDLNHPHNIVLHYWLVLGIGGVLSLLLQQVAFWRAAWHLRDKLTVPFDRALLVGATAIMVYTLAHGLIDNSFFIVDLAFVWMLVLGIVGWLRSTSTDRLIRKST